jgi:SAM-dependent methyltransferase
MPKKKEWFEHDGLWRAVMPMLFDKARIDNASGEVDDMIALTGLRPGSRVLDLCCGIGRHSIRFAGRGFDVTGVDRTGEYIKIAKDSAKESGVKVRFVNDGMLHFRKDNFYDLVISYFSSFGYFENRDDDLKVLKNIAASLRDEGKFLIDIVGKEIIARNYQRKNWVEKEGFILLEERVVEKNWTGINTRWTIIKEGKRTDLNIFHRLYSAVELIDILRQGGFSEVKIYGDIKGRPYDADASRLVAVAIK